jgi:metalloendopeptidase OMA1, mitochondrial
MEISRRCALQRMLLLGAASCGCGCRSTPITNRKQLLLVPEKQEIALGLTAYQEVTSQEPPSTNRTFVEMVNRVGLRIAEVADRPDYEWEFRVLASPTQNAFCLPGGKVAVYEGIVPVCANEAGLAVVMSHEIAHALARHGGERMSQNYAVEGVRQTVQYVANKKDLKNKEAVLQAYGVATNVGVILPYSRKHESEADHMGIMLMGKAGYDPAEAPRFWTRFAAAGQGTKPPEFLSTHPSDERRAADLAELVPQAAGLYAQAPDKHGLGETVAGGRVASRDVQLTAQTRFGSELPPPPPYAGFTAGPEPTELPLIGPGSAASPFAPRWVR